MIWQAWVLIGFFLANLLVTAYYAGSGKTARYNGTTFFVALVMYSLLIWDVVSLVNELTRVGR